MKPKAFKVAQVDMTSPNEKGLYMHVMIAGDGDCWQVWRNQTEVVPVPWQMGDTIEVVMAVRQMIGREDRAMTPKWEDLDCDHPIKFDLARPYEAVSLAWDEETAKKFFTFEEGNPKPPKRATKYTVVFKMNDFVNSPVMSAEEKMKLANQFVSFVETGYREEFMTRSMGQGLQLVFPLWGMTGSKNDSFDLDFRLATMQKIAASTPAGDPTQDVSDLARALRNYVIQQVLGRMTKGQKTADAMKKRSTLRQLLRELGVPADFKLPRQS